MLKYGLVQNMLNNAVLWLLCLRWRP